MRQAELLPPVVEKLRSKLENNQIDFKTPLARGLFFIGVGERGPASGLRRVRPTALRRIPAASSV